MTDLERVKEWLQSCPAFSDLGELHVDYTDQVPANGGLFPNGGTEISRKTDILGHVTIEKQLNFSVFYVFEKSPDDDDLSADTQNRLFELQEWVDAQSVSGLAPTFGDVPFTETVTASNAALYDATAEGLGTYSVMLTFRFKKEY